MRDRRAFLSGCVSGTVIGIVATILLGFIALRLAEDRLLSMSQARLQKYEAMHRKDLPVPRFTSPAVVGKVPLNWHLLTVKGERVPFSVFQGRAVLLNFWASWCGPCRAELPLLEALRRSIPEEDLAIILVTDEEAEPLTKFLTQSAPKIPIYRAEVDRPLEVQPKVLPSTFLMDPDGNVLLHQTGAAKWNDPQFVTALRDRLGLTAGNGQKPASR